MIKSLDPKKTIKYKIIMLNLNRTTVGIYKL